MSDEKPNPPEESPDPQDMLVPCPECSSGMMRLQHLTYFTWLNEELVTVPNFPAWVCDMCGRREYDPRAVNWLNTLLNPSAGKRSRVRRRKNKPAGLDRPQP
jgi:YgiT-type zinc finger domain-containing protein